MLKKLVVGKSKNRLKYQSIYIKLAVQLFGESKISSRMNLKNVQLPPSTPLQIYCYPYSI